MSDLIPNPEWEMAPRSELKMISIRLPGDMLKSLKKIAVQKGIGYQRLIKRFLGERIMQEAATYGGAEPAKTRNK